MKRPLRVLNLHSEFNRGGIESHLLNILSRLDPAEIRSDFAVWRVKGVPEEEPFLKLGCRLLTCAPPSLGYASKLRRLLREAGPFDVVHSHLHHFTGIALRAAAAENIPVRLAHSHIDSRHIQERAPFWKRAYLSLMKRWVTRYATGGVATSRAAAADLFGPAWETDPRFQILLCAIDFAPFREKADKAEVRKSMGIPPEATVLGHVGRFVEQKNHELLVSIFAAIAANRADVWLLLVGEGPDRTPIERRIATSGLRDRVVFAGVRDDVPRLMKTAMDLLLFPSRYEGLGLVVVEALAAGIPCVVSEAVPTDADVIPENVTRLSLNAPLEVWRDAVLRRLEVRPATTVQEALARVERSPFQADRSASRMREIYLSAARSACP